METRNEKKYQHNAYILCASKILLTLSVVIICASIATAVGPEYEVIDLGTLSGGSSSALAINNSNVVVGESGNNAFMWIDDNPPDDDTSPGEMRDFGAVSAVNYSWGEGINTAGDIVGFYGIDVSDPSNILGEAFLWEDINSNNL